MGLGGKQVVERQVEAFRQLPHSSVARVDQLAAPLGDLVGVPVAGIAEHAAADAARRFVDRAADAEIGEFQRAVQSGDAGAHDDHSRLSSRRRESRDGRCGGDRACALEERAAGEALPLHTFGARGTKVAQFCERPTACARDARVAKEAIQRVQKRCFRHSQWILHAPPPH